MRSRVLPLLALTAVLTALCVCSAGAQNLNLANQYYQNGEYEKAASLYSQLLERDDQSDLFFNRYVECMINLGQFDECEKAIKKQLKKYPDNISLYVTYGNLFDRQEKTDEAKAQYQRAIDKMSPDYVSVNRLAALFMSNGKYDFATQTYERGSKLLKDPNRFAYNLGELYRRKGDPAKMIEYYLNALSADPGKIYTIQTLLARYLAADDFTELQSQLYARIQTEDNPDMIEILAWSFVQRKDFKSALRQYKALDKRLDENGQRIYNLAKDAADARDYDTAISGFDYIVTEKGRLNPFFFDAKRESMECRRKKITEGYDYTQEDLKILEAEYENFLAQYGKGKQTSSIVLQLATLEALYINNLPKAIGLLDDLRKSPGLEPEVLARTKINLADYYLMNGEIWESTLLYSQVDKQFKEEQIGQEARFKNARLSYFNGDFQWSQAQFDILKASTSKLIANDALDLSVFIMDNLNLDTTAEAISLYSAAELLVFQNRFDEAFLKLDTLHSQFPEHSLQDDLLYLEAQIYDKKRNYEKAAALYQEVADKYPEDIRADNALFALAQLYEQKLNDVEKAKTLYEKIFIDYSGSVFAVEARKRFRILRGDNIQ
ncbi:MAG: tetratricopeptide repeat protein [Saprospiraceae bacterium]|nr:tetratricopeptide repeat protein [Saprospiraceae bacterium]MCB9356733.1 tetratricopeptide repeat protein [Lewinellaceae bacterium]